MAATIFVTHSATARDNFDLPHVPQEGFSLFELNPSLSLCPFSVTGTPTGPASQFKTFPQNDRYVVMAENDYSDGSFIDYR